MRRGCWDVQARIADMDLDGIYASVCYPSLIAGFAGTMFSSADDPALGLACLRAWNEWHLAEWHGAHPDRIIPMQLPWLLDVDLAAEEVRANAERGFRAVSFVENPHDLGLPSLHTQHWDPFLRACEETETVVCVHNASSGWTASRSPAAPLELLTTLFPVNALVATADWLWSGVFQRFPGLRLCLAESGIDWVPMLLNRLDYVMDHSADNQGHWADPELTPSEVVQRNFWFSVIDITDVISLREHIGVDHIVLESDYPHADSTWPDTQARARRGLAQLDAEDVRRITWQNAAELFRWAVPPELQVPGVAA
jgi:predicted TIM-barrel fold metal-dependent hydrolase